MDFIKYVAEVAVEDWRKHHTMLPSVVIAQAILESGWGKSELAVKANALFGIKSNSDWSGAVYVKDAVEQLKDGTYITVGGTEWRAYNSWSESILDHNNYIATRKVGNKLRYLEILGNTCYEDVCELLKKCGYATSLDYPQKLIKLIEQYNLAQYDVLGKDEEVKSMIKIALDAGHGLYTSGKQTPDGIKEWTLNDKVRDKVVAILSAYNCEIIHTDNDEGKTDESLASRLSKYKSAGVAAFVSIHHNAYTGNWNNATGVEIYTDNNPTNADIKLANAIYSRLVKYTSLRGRGVKKCDFYVINQDTIPAVLVEGGFMDSTIDYKYITSDKGQTEYAKAVADGLIEFLGLTKKTGSSGSESSNTVSSSGIASGKTLYRVQVGAFSNKANAVAMQSKLKKAGFEAIIVNG